MNKLTRITFTGVDEWTDLDKLQKIQDKYPYAEFGVLLSKNWKENGNRYLNPTLWRSLSKYKLNLSLHLCGSLSREAYQGNWEPLTELMIKNGVLKFRITKLFNRCQLNVAGCSEKDYVFRDGVSPLHFNKLIIQQKSADYCPLFEQIINSARKENGFETASDYAFPHKVCLLCDASGGMGVESAFVPYDNADNWCYVGYAGGFGEYNVVQKIEEIASCDKVGFFWVDMESKVHDKDDKFDLDCVERILKITEPFFGKQQNNKVCV